MEKKRNLYHFLIFYSLMLYIIFSQATVHLLTGELGRLLVEGRLFIEKFEIVKINHFSYPAYNYSIENYHWLSAFFMAFIHRGLGFIGLHLLMLLMTLIAVGVYVRFWFKHYNVLWVGFCSVLCIPMIVHFSEMSILVFPVVLCVLFMLMNAKLLAGKKFKRHVFLMVVLQLIWVNIHNSYHLGWIVLFATFLQVWILHKKSDKYGALVKPTAQALVFGLIVSIINPQWWRVWIHPFKLRYANFSSTPYEVQNVFTHLANLDTNISAIDFYIIMLSLTACCALYISWKYSKSKIPVVFLVLILVYTIGFSLFSTQNAPFLGVVALAIFVLCGHHYIKERTDSFFWFSYKSPFVILLYFLLPFVFWSATEEFFKPVSHKIGLGLAPNALDATAFIEYTGIQGPFFNNRDAAGAMIFSLYPNHYPFIDDRANGFPKDLVDRYYFPGLIMEDFKNWHELKNKYAINTIYFKLEGETNEKLEFLGNRLGDGEWALVYQNKNKDAILLRRNKINMEIIKQYEINPATRG